MIDEKKLIEELQKRVRTPRSTMEIIRDIIPLVEKQPKVAEWIPCSERLPEEGINVLCTEEGTQSIYVGWMTNVEELGSCWFDDDGFSMQVVAWMPLPEPYRGDEE